jgi:O-antigen/teichoic acid export membrane protein
MTQLGAWARVWDAANRAVVANASSWVATTVVTSALGFVYWWLAARQFPPATVGFAAATVSAMLLLGSVGVMGLGTLLIGELPRQPGRERSLIATALMAAGLASGALGVGFAVIAPHISTELAPLAASVASVTLFGLGVSLTAVTLVVDQAFLGLLRGEVQLGRNALFAVAKLLALALAGLWLGDGSGMVIYATWVVGSLVSLLGLAGLVAVKGGATSGYRVEWSMLRRLSGAALIHHALNLAMQAPHLALPALVATLLSTTTSAYFYVASMVAGLLFVGPVALTTALYAAGARAPAAFASRLRFSLSLATAGGLAGAGVLWLGGSHLLGLFGPAYAAEATDTLRILVLAIFPFIIRDHYVAVCRVRGQIAPAVWHTAAGGALAIALAAIGAGIAGLPGLAAGYVIAAYVQAIGMAPVVYRAARPVEGGLGAQGLAELRQETEPGRTVESGGKQWQVR